MSETRTPYFINPADAPKLNQMPGLETTIITGLYGEKLMMVLSATLPGHTVPMHAHPNEQIGMVYAEKPFYASVKRSEPWRKGISIAFPPLSPMEIPVSAMNLP